MILANKLMMLGNLKTYIERVDCDDTAAPNNPEGEASIDRVNWAIELVHEESLINQELLADLRQSLTALFQLRSIEQNELAIVADLQNKAILVFTGVTIVFLPLSFFTGYYGMNLQGIIDTTKTESYFWKVCGSIAFIIILFVSLYAFRHKFRRILERASEWQKLRANAHFV